MLSRCTRCGADRDGAQCLLCGHVELELSEPAHPTEQSPPTKVFYQPKTPSSATDQQWTSQRATSTSRRGALLGLLVGLLVLGGAFTWFQVNRAAPVAGGEAGRPSAGSSNDTPSKATYPTVFVPTGSKECARQGTGPFAAAGTANETTSCPFAINVRRAYLASGLKGKSGKIRAYSTTTKRHYVLDCSGSQPVLCTGGVAARVIIYGGPLQVG